jgi:hypothetical protein
MSGGALDYAYQRVQDAAEKILLHYGNRLGEPSPPDDYKTEYRPLALAFARHLMKVSEALRELEWEMSDDGSDLKVLRTLISPGDVADTYAAALKAMIAEAQEVLKGLEDGKPKV